MSAASLCLNAAPELTPSYKSLITHDINNAPRSGDINGEYKMPMTLKTREQWLNAFTARALKQCVKLGYTELPAIRCSIGFSSKGARSNVIGQCWSNECSADGVFEIFVVPTLTDPARIADVLTHEIVHAVVGISAGHGPKFRKLATLLGLEGKMTATVAGDAWRAWAEPVLKVIGVYPAAALNAGGVTSGPKKQTTRMIKAECGECGFTMRTSAKWIDHTGGDLRCPDHACGGDMIVG